MGRFARSSERDKSSNHQTTPTPRPSFNARSPFTPPPRRSAGDSYRANLHAPSEFKYFVLALAALIGLGIGWLSGKAITQSWNSTATPVVAEEAIPATFDGVNERSFAAPAVESDEPTDAQAAAPEAADSDESDAPVAAVTQATTNDPSARAARKATRRAAVRRAARSNIFFRPFKALRKFRVW
ncbi:MAG: hypothetical protein ACJ74J_08775 [Blastocatellia bacterium]